MYSLLADEPKVSCYGSTKHGPFEFEGNLLMFQAAATKAKAASLHELQQRKRYYAKSFQVSLHFTTGERASVVLQTLRTTAGLIRNVLSLVNLGHASQYPSFGRWCCHLLTRPRLLFA